MSQSDSNSVRRARPSLENFVVNESAFLSELVHKLGHEIGNPLTSIISLASIIEKFSEGGRSGGPALDSNQYKSYAASIVDEAWRISALSERLVLMLSDRSGNLAECYMPDLLEVAISRVQSRLRMPDFAPEIHYSDAVAPVEVDNEQIVAALIELLSNADGNHNQEADKPVKIECTSHENRSFIRIHNTATEPFQGQLSTVFDPFVTQQQEQKHLGLGLTMAAIIARRFGGDLELTERRFVSDEGKELYSYSSLLSFVSC